LTSDIHRLNPNFDKETAIDRIAMVAWYMHERKGIEMVTTDLLRKTFREMHAEPPDVSIYLPRMLARKPPLVVKQRGGYRLSGETRRTISERYGVHPTQVAVTQILSSLPEKLPILTEQVFLKEALACYGIGAFRATIVMTWNLSYHHVLAWILGDPGRLAAFNSAIPIRYPKRSDQVLTYDDFEEFKEFEVLEVIRTGRLCSKNVIDILKEKLAKRNKAAHPARVTVTQHQADDVVTDLVNNVVLLLV